MTFPGPDRGAPSPTKVWCRVGIMTIVLLAACILANRSLHAIVPTLAPRSGAILLGMIGAWAACCAYMVRSSGKGQATMLLVAAPAVPLMAAVSDAPGLVAIGVAGIGLLFLLASGVWLGLTFLRRREVPGPAPLLYGFAAIGLGVATLLAAAAFGPSGPPAPGGTVQSQLAAIYASDQNDRRTLRMLLDSSRDDVRLARVRQIAASGPMSDPRSMFHAAIILHHSHCLDDVEQAFFLADQAGQAGVHEARQLARAAYDRVMMAQGRPQKYGTQIYVSPMARCRT